MYTFLNNQKNIQVKRATRNANNLSTYANSSVITGHFRALSESESSVNGMQYGKGFMLLTSINSDVIVGDKMTIGGKEYNVQTVTSNNRLVGSIKYKRIILSFNA